MLSKISANTFRLRVYYEDTDAGGIVYHANYLRFTDRARTEFLRTCGIHQQAYRKKTGVLFVVAKCSITYIASARLDDLLDVVTTVSDVTPLRLVLSQEIFRRSQKVFTSTVTLACIDGAEKAAPLPKDIKAILAPFVNNNSPLNKAT
ncbi:MAG: tol-pal system-associated acyl-CoA thioesterase [Holosporales bacterium]|jgi:acyl-CoA thioester hydrolase|nr:tol-pal system-associated acyl-CoA thioesterase [Holosporales bacterium]